jgi:hypothetical protein
MNIVSLKNPYTFKATFSSVPLSRQRKVVLTAIYSQVLDYCRKDYPMTMDTLTKENSFTHKYLLDEVLWERLVQRIMKDKSMERLLAERIMDQTLAFLTLCALEPRSRYSPSPLVDIGWHTFILYTGQYAEFCKRIGGFIDHNPSDVPGVDYDKGNVARTVGALKRRNITIDESLWLTTSHDCSSYCSGDSCSGGGGDGDSGCDHG